MELEAMPVACPVECPVALADSQVLVELVLHTMTAQLLRRSTKLFLTNFFSWFFAFATSCHGIIKQWQRCRAGFFSNCG